MDRTYDQMKLIPINPLSLEWARMWVRFLLHDVPHGNQGGDFAWQQYSKADVELNAALELDAVGPMPTRYYRPHVTARRLYLGDPTIWKTRAVDGTSETMRSAQEVTDAWVDQGRAIDALIPEELLPKPQAVNRGLSLLVRRSLLVQPELSD